MRDNFKFRLKRYLPYFCAFLFFYHLNFSSAFAADEVKEEGGKRRYLHEAYLTNTTSQYIIGIGGLRMQKYFEPQDKEAVWVGRFNILANINSRFRAEWHSPDGNIFEQKLFGTFYGNSRYAIASLNIKDKIPENLYGKWKVVVFWDDEKIDERYFYIDTKPNLTKAQEEEYKKWSE